MNALLTLAGVAAPAAAAALLAGGICPPEGCSAAAQTRVVQRSLGATSALHAHLAGLHLAAQPQSHAQVHTHIKVVQRDDSGVCELVIENGQPAARINGDEVPPDRIRRLESGVWTIVHEDGSEVARFHINAAPAVPAPPALSGNMAGDRPVDMGSLPRLEQIRPGATLNLSIERPRTMLGVVMAPAPGDAGESDGILIERVVEGLPADHAGIQSGDIIVAIEGAGQASPEALRALLRDKPPGDQVKVTLRRDGDEKQVAVTLQAFDNQKLTGMSEQASPGTLNRTFAGSLSDLSADARLQMEEALEALSDAERLATGETRQAHEHARKAIEQFVAALERMEAEGLSTGEAMRGELGRWFGQFKDDQMVWGDKPGMVFTVPPNSFQFNRDPQRSGRFAGGNTETGAEAIRKDDVESRLNAMADRLERIEKLLEKLAGDAPGAAPSGQ